MNDTLHAMLQAICERRRRHVDLKSIVEPGPSPPISSQSTYAHRQRGVERLLANKMSELHERAMKMRNALPSDEDEWHEIGAAIRPP